jgi:hypothetical protein
MDWLLGSVTAFNLPRVCSAEAIPFATRSAVSGRSPWGPTPGDRREAFILGG